MSKTILTREQAKVKAWTEFTERTPRIIEVSSDWSELSPKEKLSLVKHKKNMLSLMN